MKRKLIIIFLILISIVTWSFAFFEYLTLRNNINYIGIRDDLHFPRIPSHKLSVSEVDLIGPWMTFDYINNVFDVPAFVLKDNLQIKNSKYPKISIRQYVKDEKLDSKTFLENVKIVVEEYLSANPK